MRLKYEPAAQRLPPEIWQLIVYHTHRYHLRAWLFISSFHRDIALDLMFHTTDLYFSEDPERLNRGLDIFDRVKADAKFAKKIKIVRGRRYARSIDS